MNIGCLEGDIESFSLLNAYKTGIIMKIISEIIVFSGGCFLILNPQHQSLITFVYNISILLVCILIVELSIIMSISDFQYVFIIFNVHKLKGIVEMQLRGHPSKIS